MHCKSQLVVLGRPVSVHCLIGSPEADVLNIPQLQSSKIPFYCLLYVIDIDVTRKQYQSKQAFINNLDSFLFHSSFSSSASSSASSPGCSAPGAFLLPNTVALILRGKSSEINASERNMYPTHVTWTCIFSISPASLGTSIVTLLLPFQP